MITDLSKVRNIGISAHIDSGKTTLTERILFYTKRIHAIHEVKGKDGVGAKMDSMELERERGITIQSAATYCTWSGSSPKVGIKSHHINIIDTPGHVDFTVEVERSLRVLDGAIMVLCGVAGVQSQSYTVDRQMRRYNVPRIAFVNKLDRSGANPFRVRDQLREKLRLHPVMIQAPIGLEDKLEGVVDLIEMNAVRFYGDNGNDIEYSEIPAEMKEQCDKLREEMLDQLSMVNDELTEAMLEDKVTPELIRKCLRDSTIALKCTPVMMGSALGNKGVQLLLDGVTYFLPDPTEVKNIALDLDKSEEPQELASDPTKPLVLLAFKLEDGRYGQLTYIRVYQGKLEKDDFITNTRTGKKVKVGRLVRMHSDDKEDISDTSAGDICALFGIDCNSGDTFTDGTVNLAMTSMFVPKPVISVAIKAKDSGAEINMSKALNRFTKEDPTFQCYVDPESNETIIAGMGELHLDVYIERMKREYKAEVVTSPPQVAYRETIGAKVDFNYTHKKQTGGSGQYGRVAGYAEPFEGDFEFADEIKGGAIPREFIPSCEKGFKSMMAKSPRLGVPVVGIRVAINDGQSHAVDSSDIAFQEAARGAFRDFFQRARPKILEPIMKVSLEGPAEFSGNMLSLIMQRRGIVIGSSEEDGGAKVDAEVPLAEMFGFSTPLRSSTQGKAEFSMEFAKYSEVPSNIGEELLAKAAKAKADAKK
ncbi:MAG: elongation factor G [Kofleriaceae bacterium]|nr:elongation factor G [Kofleriaceae bacterium]MBP9166408.1 elongation factor G [Kofleriaceae bacterium]MBP9858649.1 elongation factor G [Kofleriaceae bacterium]